MMTLDTDAKHKEFIDESVPSSPAQLLNCKLGYVLNNKHIEASAVECTKLNAPIHGMVHHIKQQQFDAFKASVVEELRIVNGKIILNGSEEEVFYCQHKS